MSTVTLDCGEAAEKNNRLKCIKKEYLTRAVGDSSLLL